MVTIVIINLFIICNLFSLYPWFFFKKKRQKSEKKRGKKWEKKDKKKTEREREKGERVTAVKGSYSRQ